MISKQKVSISVSNGGVMVKNINGTGIVYYTTGRVYSSEEKRSNPVRVTIGKQWRTIEMASPRCVSIGIIVYRRGI